MEPRMHGTGDVDAANSLWSSRLGMYLSPVYNRTMNLSYHIPQRCPPNECSDCSASNKPHFWGLFLVAVSGTVQDWTWEAAQDSQHSVERCPGLHKAVPSGKSRWSPDCRSAPGPSVREEATFRFTNISTQFGVSRYTMIDPSLNLYHTRSGKRNILSIKFHIDYTIILAGIASCIIMVKSWFLLVYCMKSTSSREYIKMIFSAGMESNGKLNIGHVGYPVLLSSGKKMGSS